MYITRVRSLTYSHIFIHTHVHTRSEYVFMEVFIHTHTESQLCKGGREREREGRDGDRTWREREKNQPPRGEGEKRGPGIRKSERNNRGTDDAGERKRGKTRERKREEGGRILTDRWGMSRRVVCSHGSSLGTAVQYAGQGKVTLLRILYVCACGVRARARVRGAHYYLCPRVYNAAARSALCRVVVFLS